MVAQSFYIWSFRMALALTYMVKMAAYEKAAFIKVRHYISAIYMKYKLSPSIMKSSILSVLFLLTICCDSKSQNMTPEKYLELGQYIWKTYVPKSGQAQTVQGELLRAIEKLADEAQRNGNINFNVNCHGILIGYLRKHLTDTKIFDEQTIKQINKDLDRISVENEPYIEDDLYDRLRERIIDWYLKNTTPIQNIENLKLNC